MSTREAVRSVLHYENVKRTPVVHFGFWQETLDKWHREGHLSREDRSAGREGCPAVNRKLGFDFNWFSTFFFHGSIYPIFEREILEERADGSRVVRNRYGVAELEKPGAGGIPMEIDHTLKDRRSWEQHYLPRLQFSEQRILQAVVLNPDDGTSKPFAEGGLDILRKGRSQPLGLYCGSLLGDIRNWLGVVNLSYLQVDDEDLLSEIIQTVADLDYRNTEAILKTGAEFDFAHFWEDVCFKNGPLISPSFFRDQIGPHYRRITTLLKNSGIDIVSVDCDGLIDALLPIWLENGVNTMFPIEVGTWGASIEPWRKKYGKELRGVGGMRKAVFSEDRKAIDREIERLKPLVAFGGYIPCPDHRIPPDAEWDNVRYYCDRMSETF